jgi:hypothetical protein
MLVVRIKNAEMLSAAPRNARMIAGHLPSDDD